MFFSLLPLLLFSSPSLPSSLYTSHTLFPLFWLQCHDARVLMPTCFFFKSNQKKWVFLPHLYDLKYLFSMVVLWSLILESRNEGMNERSVWLFLSAAAPRAVESMLNQSVP